MHQTLNLIKSQEGAPSYKQYSTRHKDNKKYKNIGHFTSIKTAIRERAFSLAQRWLFPPSILKHLMTLANREPQKAKDENRNHLYCSSISTRGGGAGRGNQCGGV